MARIIALFAALTTIALSVSARPDKVVCYYGSWAVYRQGDGKFPVESIDPFKCTHAIYTFVGINSDGSIRILDAWNEIDLGALKRFNALKEKNPNLKTLIAIGGWNEGSTTFSQVAANSGLRQKFAQNALAFMEKHGFDGFDLDWEYPAQRGGASYDKQNVVLMVEALRKIFDASGRKYLITAAVAASAAAADISYNIPEFSANLDFINLMAYDFHGAFDGRTGHNAPLYSDDSLNVYAAVKAWISRGAPANKIVLGLAVYGRSFTVKNPSSLQVNNGLDLPAYAGEQGPFTGEPGMLGYNEICILRQQGGWKEIWDDKQKVPVMYKGNQWIGFDNEKSIRAKVDFAVSMNLGGAMIWSIETEDIYGFCGRSYPILSTINEALFGSSNANSGNPNSGNEGGNEDIETSGENGVVSTEKTTTKRTTTETTTTAVNDVPIGNDRTDCSSAGYVRDIENCNVYHYCYNNQILNSFNCPPGLFFNADLWVCDWPYNVPEC